MTQNILSKFSSQNVPEEAGLSPTFWTLREPWKPADG